MTWLRVKSLPLIRLQASQWLGLLVYDTLQGQHKTMTVGEAVPEDMRFVSKLGGVFNSAAVAFSLDGRHGYVQYKVSPKCNRSRFWY